MKTNPKSGIISKRIVLASVILLLAVSVKANSLNPELNSNKESMFVFYVTGAIFFAAFLIKIISSRLSKINSSIKSDKYLTHERKYQYHKKVIRKTA